MRAGARALALLLFLSACGGGGGPSVVVDPGADGSDLAVTDPGGGDARDGGNDPSRDRPGGDAAEDPGTDPGPDAVVDEGGDAVGDPGADTATDEDVGSVDPGPDAPADAGLDGGDTGGAGDAGDAGDDRGSVDPGSGDLGGDDPGPDDPGGTDPGALDPGRDPGPDPASDPGTNDPGRDPGPTDPGTRDPGVDGATDPGATDPGTTDPGTTDPGSDPGPACGVAVAGLFPSPAWAGGPSPNAYSWDGAWTPADGDFPIPGLFDDEYFDGHSVEGQPTPILPPGRWDWIDADNDWANWRNLARNLGTFGRLRDNCGRHYGWRFLPLYPDAVDFQGPGEYFDGSSGTDLLLLGTRGRIHSISGSLGGGPDVLVFGGAWSLDYRTGVQGAVNAAHDDDLVVAGCRDGQVAAECQQALYPVCTTTIHAGPGADTIFARNLRASAIDAGNGAGGRTDTLDPTDGDDFAVLGGSVKDVRFFGGLGDDVLVWYADEMGEKTPYQGGDYFGGGGAGEALWGDPGTDRLVMAVPDATRIVRSPSSPPVPGTILIIVADPGVTAPWWDEPTVNDPYAKYCITCGEGPLGQHTLYLQYASADGTVDTGYISVTAFEELQVGIGPAAKVYRLNQATGAATEAADRTPISPPAYPYEWCDRN
jgi:hypothetical protein